MRGLKRRSSARPSAVATGQDPAESPASFDFNLEVCNADGVIGWVVHPAGVAAVRVLLHDRPVGEVRWGQPRIDVAAAFPEVPESLDSGFTAIFPRETFSEVRPQKLVVEFTARDGSRLPVSRQVWPVRIAGGDSVRRVPTLAPFPTDVIATLAELRPDQYEPSKPWSADIVGAAVDDIVRILNDRVSVKPILRYAHYLHTMSMCFAFIGSHFDRINLHVDASSKDFEAVASSPQEMLCIANHLYVLRSRGHRGGVIECGCFKGFSTCCLSQACAWLGLQLHVFDSFEGLPPSSGGYYQAGDFRGTIDEVTDNLKTFGQPAVVELHKGYFADTLPHFSDPFSCIWMDVDLESSAKDVMTLLPSLPADSCVFSHELPHQAFIGSQPQPDASEVLPPILDAFRGLDLVPVGRHMTGYLGAVWADGRGTPVLGHEEISRVVEAART